MTTASIETPREGPLTPQHHRELAKARDEALPIRKAARVATFNAWATGVVAALSAPFALFSITGLLVAISLATIAYNEFRGRRRLLAFDPSAASFLGWNQLCFLALIVTYSMWMLYSGLSADNSLTVAVATNPDLKAAGVDLSELGAVVRLCLIAVYGTVIVLSTVFQGLNALYYFTRRKYIETYVAHTPNWVRNLHCSTFSG